MDAKQRLVTRRTDDPFCLPEVLEEKTLVPVHVSLGAAHVPALGAEPRLHCLIVVGSRGISPPILPPTIWLKSKETQTRARAFRCSSGEGTTSVFEGEHLPTAQSGREALLVIWTVKARHNWSPRGGGGQSQWEQEHNGPNGQTPAEKPGQEASGSMRSSRPLRAKRTPNRCSVVTSSPGRESWQSLPGYRTGGS
jgi:hypothetical protein